MNKRFLMRRRRLRADYEESDGDEIHRKIMDDLNIYALVGGMPRTVEVFLSTGNIAIVDTVKREVLV